ncbi:MAG: tryptophan synthase subunit alpha [Nitrospirota bacterium]|nr:tryptophan synthase subunit alpha [Nitrospirota bacterium]
MSRIEATLKNVLLMQEKSLIAYVMAGDPSLAATEEIVLEVDRAGADLIEIGVPFSDPIADGPTIQKAADRALKHNVSMADVLVLVAKLRKQTKVPLILMSYCNPILAYGLPQFFKEARRVGVNGLIVPDLPPEEAGGFLPLARRELIDMIFLVAPTTPDDRLKKILKTGSGFVYYVPLTGVTGSKLSGKAEVCERITALKTHTDRPVAAGFGIASPEDAREIGQAADGIIVGSALVKIIGTATENPNYLSDLSAFVSSLKEALRKS